MRRAWRIGHGNFGSCLFKTTLCLFMGMRNADQVDMHQAAPNIAMYPGAIAPAIFRRTITLLCLPLHCGQ
jgi:hypothetical protein